MAYGTQHTICISTTGRGLHPLTAEVNQLIASSNVSCGLCHCFVQHTSCSLIINENADPDVPRDLERFFSDLVPDGDPRYRHTAEGPDDMSAHVRTVLTHTSLSIPIVDATLALGTWQGLYLWEHRARAHQRRVIITLQALSH